MKCITLIVLLVEFFYVIYGEENEKSLDCKDFEALFVGSIFSIFSKKELKKNEQTNFLIATRELTEATNVGYDDWSALFGSGFDLEKKTYFIIHGFQSGAHKPWVLDLKSELLKTVDVNIILVNWKHRSNQWNYVDAVRSTIVVRDDIFRFLQGLKNQTKQRANSNEVSWNKLYFIGHSLGAQISGQIARLLKEDEFFTVERITGLDPAQPCFRNVSLDLRLDKDDAYFVDAIHTQTGNSNSTDGFGLKIPVGHTDFYINGGITQPKCQNSVFNVGIQQMVCSHKISCEYFVESVIISRTNQGKFLGYKWDSTSKNALEILKKSVKNVDYSNCVEMGFNAKKSDTNGVYIAFTGSKLPYHIYVSDISMVENCIKKLDISTSLEQDVWEATFDSPFERK